VVVSCTCVTACSDVHGSSSTEHSSVNSAIADEALMIAIASNAVKAARQSALKNLIMPRFRVVVPEDFPQRSSLSAIAQPPSEGHLFGWIVDKPLQRPGAALHSPGIAGITNW